MTSLDLLKQQGHKTRSDTDRYNHLVRLGEGLLTGRTVPVPALSNRTADQSEIRCGGKHVTIICPDFNKPVVCGRNQMECVESS